MKRTAGVYETLADHLDSLPGGFPRTQSGVELRILRRLFSPDEAELATRVSLIPEEARVIAMRARIARDEASRRLEAMARKGLIMELPRQKGAVQYAAAQFVIGIWEFHLNDLDTALIADFEEYLPSLAREALKFPQLRTIPVNRSIAVQLNVLPYERAEELVGRAKKLLVAPCICRRERRMVGKGCSAPEEACLVFDIGADIFERNGLGRLIERREALDILAAADDAGLVLQPANHQASMNICCCCGCCCGVLRTIGSFPRPAVLVSSAFVALLNRETCSGCGTCVERCTMHALVLGDGTAVLDPDRCIGCGLCVSTCPTGALALQRKPEAEQPDVPKDGVRAAIRLAQARGKLGPVSLAMKVVQSKVDRLRSLG